MTTAALAISPTSAIASPYVTKGFLFQSAQVLERRITTYGAMSEVDGKVGDRRVPSEAAIPKQYDPGKLSQYVTHIKSRSTNSHVITE